MTRDELADLLNGREYGEEITKEESAAIRRDGLAIVYGASDDLMEFEGIIHAEVDAYEGATVYVDNHGILPTWDQAVEAGESGASEYLRRKPLSKTIQAIWTDRADDPLPPWSYQTDIPHSTFEIMEDGEVFCRGIVFSLADLL